jgi:hypothetical protein
MNPYRPWKSGASAPRQAQDKQQGFSPGRPSLESGVEINGSRLLRNVGFHNSAGTADDQFPTGTGSWNPTPREGRETWRPGAQKKSIANQ